MAFLLLKHFEFVGNFAVRVIDTAPLRPLPLLITIIRQPNVLNVNALRALFLYLF